MSTLPSSEVVAAARELVAAWTSLLNGDSGAVATIESARRRCEAALEETPIGGGYADSWASVVVAQADEIDRLRTFNAGTNEVVVDLQRGLADQRAAIDRLTNRLEAAEKVVELVRENSQWLLNVTPATARRLLADVAAYDAAVESHS